MTRHREMISRGSPRALALGAWVAFAVATPQAALPATQPASFLDGVHRQTTLTSTVPDNGDQNPYAIVVAPVSAGAIQKDDVLITNFNNAGNLQGFGTTIVDYNPTTKKLTTFAALPRNLAGCPGGVGLTTAMTMLKTGWVIVGSAPSADGTTATKGAGCLIVLDSNGKVAGTIAGDKINMPWGNMAMIDNGDTATLFVSNAGFDVGSPEGDPRVVNEATVLRIKLSIPEGKPPEVVDQTVVGSGFGSQPNKDVFLIGPTGLALGPERYALRLGCDRQPDQRDLGRDDTRSQRRRRPDRHQGWPAADAAGDDDGAERPSPGRQRQERPGGGNRSGERRPAQGAVDRSEQGAEAAGQRRFVRHRHDAGGRWLLFCRGRVEHAW